MKRVAIIGHFAFGKEYLDGQTVKTKIISAELCKILGEDNVLQFDTHGGITRIIKALLHAFMAMKQAKNIIILPANNGLRIFARLLPIMRRIFKDRKLHYVVIGGWLSDFLESHKNLVRFLKEFDGIYVETNTMKMALENHGFKNIYIMPNCKELETLSLDELVYQSEAPYKLCTFSRVMKEKGIEDAVNTIKAINEKHEKIIYTLDIYGQVDPGQIEWFNKLKSGFPEYVRYKGVVPFDKSVDVLKNYFALLFPTRFYTEGIPGTIIDGYAAGVPVISAKWQSFADVVDDGSTGVGYEFGNVEDLENKLWDIIRCVDGFNALKLQCVEKSKQYIPQEAIKVIVKELT